MYSAFREIDKISSAIKAGVSILEPKIIALPVATRIPAGASAGEIMTITARSAPSNPVSDLARVRKHWKITLQKQTRRLDSVEKHGYQLLEVLDFIESGAEMPAMDAPQFISAARILRLAKQTGEPVGPTVDKARRSVDDGLREIRRIKSEALPAWRGAANVIISKFSAKHYEKCSQASSDLDEALKWEIKADTMAGVHERFRKKNLNRARDRDQKRMAGVIHKNGALA